MQDLSRYRKKDSVEIGSKYISPLAVGAVVITGLVFATGVLVGSRNRSGEMVCPEPDILLRLNQLSGEPDPPVEMTTNSFHTRLADDVERIPMPASLRKVNAAQEEDSGESALSEAEELSRVHLETPKADEERVLERIRDEDAGIFTLQVGSFQDQREASLLVNRLKKAGHNSFLVRVNMRQEDGGTWYRVRVGPFHSRRQAWAYKEQFEEKERLPTFVVKRRT